MNVPEWLMSKLVMGGIMVAALLAGAGILHVIGWMGKGKSKPGDLPGFFCRGLGLDLVITYFTALPWIVGYALEGWGGVVASVIAQIVTVSVWTVLHELANRDVTAKGKPRIVHSLNKNVGRVRNHAAVWWTAWAVPVFWVTRVAQYLVYPPLTWLIRLPAYDSNEWVNVSRQKFRGLVGHDLIWCLYCDWMTGVWSLGTEMLRNVESFWCPIKFDSSKKCENCKIDFPDVEGGWVSADSDIAAVVRVIEEKYPKGQRENGWFGHPNRQAVTARLTVEGKAVGEK